MYHFDALFSSHSLIYNSPKTIGWLNGSAYLLTNHFSVYSGVLLISIVGLLSFLFLCKISHYATRALLWLAIININNFLYPTLTGGDYLLNQLLFFNIFFNDNVIKNKISYDIKTATHNTSLIAIKVQICLVYLLSALLKLQDESWINGTALHFIFQIPEYSNALLNIIPSSICSVLTYATLLYQLIFCVMVFTPQFKKYVLAFGLLQHLAIALFMGLFSFGCIMIISYIVFLKYDNRNQIKSP